MNVINFSGGGPQTDPANDAMYETVHNTALAGVVPVIAAGNDREDFGLGTAGSPGTAPDAISVAATSNSHVFAPALTVVGRPAVARRDPDPERRRREAPRRAGRRSTRRSSTSRRSSARTASRSRRTSAAPPTDPNTGLGTLPKGSLERQDRCSSRAASARSSRRRSAQQLAGAIGLILVDNRFGEANPIPVRLPIPAGMISDLDGAAPARATSAANGGQATIRVSSGHPGDPDRTAAA